jgi:hypothetical protein
VPNDLTTPASETLTGHEKGCRDRDAVVKWMQNEVGELHAEDTVLIH